MAHDQLLVKLTCVVVALSWVGLATAEPRPILLELSVDVTVVDRATLSQAISQELDCAVVSDRQAMHSGELSIKSLPGGRVSVAFTASEHQAPLMRVVTLPKAPEQRAQWIAWLVGNLARNEAAEWLAQHQREKAEEGARQAGANHGHNATESNAEQNSPTAAATPNSEQNEPAKPQQVAVTPPLQLPPRPSKPNPELSLSPINLAVWHGWLELRPHAESKRLNFHLGLGYGRVGAIRGAGFDILHHRTDVEVQGVVGSLGWTRVGRTRGLAWSAGVVTARGDLAGADFAWLLSMRDANPAADQLSERGLPIDSSIVGLQFGGIAAVSQGSMVGAQTAGILTKHSAPLRGAQMSLVANVAEDIEGAQMSAVNLAGDIHGVQVGLINVAHHVDGLAIGLVNISDNVRPQAQTWVERDYHENIGLRYVYQPFTFGYSAGYDPSQNRARVLFAVGARFVHGRFAVAPSLDAGFAVDRANQTGSKARGHENDVRISAEFELVPRLLALSAGPALAFHSDSGSRSSFTPRWFAGLVVF